MKRQVNELFSNIHFYFHIYHHYCHSSLQKVLVKLNYGGPELSIVCFCINLIRERTIGNPSAIESQTVNIKNLRTGYWALCSTSLPRGDAMKVSMNISQVHITYHKYLKKALCVFKYIHLPLYTLHAEICCCKHTISTVGAIYVESWNHEELRHVGSTPIPLCELISREQVSQHYFPVVKCILP